MNQIQGLELSPVFGMSHQSCFSTQTLKLATRIPLQPPQFYRVSELLDEPQCSSGSWAPFLPITFFFPSPSIFSSLHLYPKNVPTTLTITVSSALFPTSKSTLSPFIIKPLQRVVGKLSSLLFHVLPNRSGSGFCHQHSTEKMSLKIPSLPHWPAGWVSGFSPHPHLHNPTLFSFNSFPNLTLIDTLHRAPVTTPSTHTEILLCLCVPCGHFPEFSLFYMPMR